LAKISRCCRRIGHRVIVRISSDQVHQPVGIATTRDTALDKTEWKDRLRAIPGFGTETRGMKL
jgi:hypothetical protein